ncbi:MAG: HAD family phosphatase [Clostridiales bacterium]|nr:HAD family phosphatase [Clostridiales bacterium]
MNAADRHLIATDLDDTILSQLYSLSAKSTSKLMALKEAGHIVMIATARPTCLALPYYRIMGLDSLLSTVNGNYLYHPDDPKIPMIRHELNEGQMQWILDAMKNAGINEGYLHIDDLIYLHGQEPDHPYFHLMFGQSELRVVDQLPLLPCGRFFAFSPTIAQAQEAEAQLASCQGINVITRPKEDGTAHMVITPVTADKWYTVQEAARYYGIDEKNIWCFGDEENDRLMVMNAAHGHAMVNGNPKLVADMRALGKGVTRLPCSEDGVGDILDQLLK